MVAPATYRDMLRVLVTCLLATAAAEAGEVQLSWDPSGGADGYRVYRATTQGGYGAPMDVGNTTQTAVQGLDDCTGWFFAVTAYNAGGESGFSTEKQSWPRAVLDSASPSVVEAGTQVTVVIGGTNFRDGDTIALSNPGLQLDAVTLDACQQMTLALTVAADAPLGPTDVVVTHPSGVAGTGSALFSIAPQALPTVLATSPLDGAHDVPLTVTPTVQFSEAVGGVTSSSVRLLDDQGAPVPQAQGSPALSDGDTVATITPAGELEPARTYRIQVIGGAAGVHDLHGHPMAGDHLQSPGFTTTSGPFHHLRFEAEAGLLASPLTVAQGGGAFGGAWIDTPGGIAQGSATDPNGSALFGVNLPEAGLWYLWVRIYGDDGASNSWFESIDGAARQTISTFDFGTWTWVEGGTYDLGAGLHAVELAGRDGGTRADRLLLTNDPNFVPGEEPGADVTPPGAVQTFTATPGADHIDLSWTNPPDGDLSTVVVRYRTDGQYPTSPVDGLPLVEAPATPGSDDSHRHAGVNPETSYRYSAFAVDDSGNVSAAAHALGAVAGVPPPPQNVVVH